MLGYLETADMLEPYGIPLAPYRFIQADAAEASRQAVMAAKEFSGAGYRECALKLVSGRFTHKSDMGLIKLGLSGSENISMAVNDLYAKVPNAEDREGLLVQPMFPMEREFFLGAHIDPQFGPVVAFGPGGIYVDLIGGIDFLAAPFDRNEARAMLERNAFYPILKGLRGAKPANIDAVLDCMLALSAFIVDRQDSVSSLDINPLVAYPDSVVALDIRAEGKPA